MKSDKKLELNVLVEKDGKGFVLSVPGVQGAHAYGDTLQQAVTNLEEVLFLIKNYHGSKKLKKVFSKNLNLKSVMPMTLQYA